MNEILKNVNCILVGYNNDDSKGKEYHLGLKFIEGSKHNNQFYSCTLEDLEKIHEVLGKFLNGGYSGCNVKDLNLKYIGDKL